MAEGGTLQSELQEGYVKPNKMSPVSDKEDLAENNSGQIVSVA